jgi:hypothetical protein
MPSTALAYRTWSALDWRYVYGGFGSAELMKTTLGAALISSS